jgi:uncharacterized alpha-E superfamily protein
MVLRLLDVKYYVLLPQVELAGSGLDNYQWRMLLRAMSAHRAFNWAYGGEITPTKIADFLILNPMCPRSLRTSIEGLAHHLDRLSRTYGASGPAQSKARGMLGEIAEARIEDVQDEGLNEYLARHVKDLSALGLLIHDVYLSGEAR